MTEQTLKRGGTYVGLGLALGAALGVAFDNPAIGVVTGLLIGVVLTARTRSQRRV